MKLKDGYTYMHEHVTIDLSKVKNDDDCYLNCFDETVKEFKHLYELGVRNIVELTNIGMGRDVEYIKKVEEATGLNILKATGWYKNPFIPEEYLNMSVEELANIMIHEIEDGFEGIDDSASIIGEIGTSKNEWKDCEKKLFDAAILAHKKTGKPISTHTTLATLALEQANYLVNNGVNPKKVVIGHIDLSGDIDLIRKVLKTGVNVGFDTVGKNSYLSDDKRIEMLLILEKENLIGQVVMSEDLTRKSHFKYKGGIGYSYLLETFIPKLKEAGFKEESVNKLLIENPKRIFEE